jgi:hypothetical protein
LTRYATGRRARTGLVAAALLAACAVTLSAQSLRVRTAGDMVHITTTDFPFIEGPTLTRLRGGRSVRIDFELVASEGPDGSAVAESRQSFNLSYDLWEERFAVTRIGSPRRSISHLTARDAEAWCLDQITLPAATLGRSGRQASFWLRLAYRVADPDPAPPASEDSAFTLQRLIDLMSRRREGDADIRSVQGGPFRVSN